MFYVDAHCDSVTGGAQLDLRRLSETFGADFLQFFACFSKNGDYSVINAQLDVLDKFPRKHIVKAVEGCDFLENHTERLKELFDRGVRSFGLTWNHANCLCGGAKTPEVGLTDYGREIVRRIETLGGLVDLAHISRQGFWDILDIAKIPFAVSHACCAALCDHRRNLDNAQLRALSESGGVVGICLYPPFLSDENCADLDTYVAHICHAHRVAGRESVGFGTDFDGIDQTPVGIEDVTCMPRVLDALRRQGLPPSDVDLIAGGNWLRLLNSH